jgi:DNA-binding MarR family transcriptional regulator
VTEPAPADPAELGPAELAAYFALMEVSSLLQHAVEQQLRAAGDLSLVQFKLLARLRAAGGQQRMTDLADGLVHSRSGLTYQARLLAEAGLVTRSPSVDDDRVVVLALTDAGRERLAAVLPGHVEEVRRLLLDHLDPADLATLTALLGRVRDRMRAAPPRSAAPRGRRVSGGGPAAT